MFKFDDVLFEQRLRETILFCASRADDAHPRESLRSETVAPPLLGHSRVRTVRWVADLRATQVRLQRLDAFPRGGRLLVHFPDADLADGAAEVVSDGFFDLHNTPPWDTWVALAEDPSADRSYRQYLVAWVPPALIPKARDGIAVNPERCIAWLDDVDVGARDELRSISSLL